MWLHSTAADKNTSNEERKMMPGSGEGDISAQWWGSSFPFRHKEMELCQKPCRCVSEWHADFHCSVTVALVKRKQKIKIPSTVQVFLYLSCDFYIPSAARWHVHKHFKKMPRSHSKSSLHCYLPVVVRLVHQGSLSAAIVRVLWRKHRGVRQPQTGWDKQVP